MMKLFNNNKLVPSSDAHNPRRVHTILSPDELASGKRPKQWKELEITGGVRNLSPQLWSMTHLTSLYLNDNHLQRIPPDISRLTMLKHLDLSHNKLRNVPPQIGELVLLKELLLNNNSLRSLPYEMGKLFQMQKLCLKNNPLNSDLLAIYHEPGGVQKLITYLLDNLAAMYPAPKPAQRPWTLMEQPVDRSRPSCMFTVMCYNVLCDKYATRQLYGYCPSWALNWEYRRHSIMEELKANSADIIALQEVETEQYHQFFLHELKQEGYEGIFSPKSRAKTMSESERKYVDGCAIFYRTSKFSLISEHLIEFNQLAMANAEGSDDMLNRVMTKDNIALAALLQIKEGAFDSLQETSNNPSVAPGAVGAAAGGHSLSSPSPMNQQQLHQRRLLVCAAHMYWDPQFCDVKIIQTIMLTHELQAIANKAASDLLSLSKHNNNSNSRNNNNSVGSSNNLATNQTMLNGCNDNVSSSTMANNNMEQTNNGAIGNCNDTSETIANNNFADGNTSDQLGADIIPLILCGDFNSLPESSVVEFLNNGCISADHRDFKKLAYKDCLRKICNSNSSALSSTQHSHQSQYSSTASKVSPPVAHVTTSSAPSSASEDKSTSSSSSTSSHTRTDLLTNNFNSITTTISSSNNSCQRNNNHDPNSLLTSTNSSESNVYTHPFAIGSAYSGEGSMPYTNYTFHFKGVIDYIFYSKNLMSVLGVSGFDKSWLVDNNITGLPHPYFPSDHLPLYIELEILPTPRTQNSENFQHKNMPRR
ncbi:CCR4-NOT transcription complex subunit 6 [Fragariocoptes setiger]|uniref:poly(A)-specific ribonuclease n=1 Tax=Fragariocoptes setiger TaxID=1670756 RepID=A0ABQ7S546_9ACAR|nr:CCR4-NOT transcription complex subunit 6 [Fragariocoptes setiger]